MNTSMDITRETGLRETRLGIDRLIGDLASSEGMQRQRARKRLVDIGRLATPPLVETLQSTSKHARWEAAKALGAIQDPGAAPALVGALRDQESSVRWLAAKGLIGLGRDALIPLLESLEKESDSVWMREGAHRVLHALVEEDVANDAAPVLEALEDIEPAIEVPIAAFNLLQVLRRQAEESPIG
jgi:HEAT repeat protein